MCCIQDTATELHHGMVANQVNVGHNQHSRQPVTEIALCLRELIGTWNMQTVSLGTCKKSHLELASSLTPSTSSLLTYRHTSTLLSPQKTVSTPRAGVLIETVSCKELTRQFKIQLGPIPPSTVRTSFKSDGNCTDHSHLTH